MNNEKAIKRELLKAGYAIDSASNEWYYGNLYFGTMDTAYAYLRMQKQFEAMRELLLRAYRGGKSYTSFSGRKHHWIIEVSDSENEFIRQLLAQNDNSRDT